MNTKQQHQHILITPPFKASSQIFGTGYDPHTRTLAIQFHSKSGPGSVYHYADFPPEKWEAMQKAESLGSYFGEHVKGHDPKRPLHMFTKIEKK